MQRLHSRSGSSTCKAGINSHTFPLSSALTEFLLLGALRPSISCASCIRPFPNNRRHSFFGRIQSCRAVNNAFSPSFVVFAAAMTSHKGRELERVKNVSFKKSSLNFLFPVLGFLELSKYRLKSTAEN